MASYDQTVLPFAEAAAAQLGDSTAEILGQWNAETGYGSEQTTGTYVNNPGNVEVGGQVVSFPTMQDGVAAYVNTEKNYGVNDASNVDAFANANEPYGGNSSYPSLLEGTIEGPQTQAAANSASGSDAALLASVPTAAELKAAEKGKPVYNPSTMGGVSGTSSGCSFLGWNYCSTFEDNWEYLVMILVIILLLGAGFFGLSKTVTGSGIIPIGE